MESGAVKGALVQTEDGMTEVRTRRGVVLAAGGFPQDVLRRKELFAHAPSGQEHWSPAPPGNTGDGIRLGEKVGGRAIAGLPNAAAWVPVSLVPRRDGTSGPFPHFIDRGKPGVIAVTKSGKRFTNEANSYHDFVQAMVGACGDDPEKAAWLIVDHPTIRRYGLGFVEAVPGAADALPAERLSAQGAHLTRTCSRRPASIRRPSSRRSRPTIATRARATTRSSSAAAPPTTAISAIPITSRTPASARSSAVRSMPSRWCRAISAPSPASGPIRNAQVIDEDGQVIPGLYAAGNDMASIMGGNYPGGGITLGPAMTFGYIAGRHLAGVAETGSAAADRPAA